MAFPPAVDHDGLHTHGSHENHVGQETIQGGGSIHYRSTDLDHYDSPAELADVIQGLNQGLRFGDGLVHGKTPGLGVRLRLYQGR